MRWLRELDVVADQEGKPHPEARNERVPMYERNGRNVSDQDQSSSRTLPGVNYLKDRDSRPQLYDAEDPRTSTDRGHYG